MLTEQRFDIILKLLEERKSITVTELRELLDASESTVRRDITALDKAGKLTKVFGGAVALNHKVTAYEPTVAQKSELNKEEKKKMEQKDELTNSGQRFPVEQVSNTGKPTKKQVKAAVKELNPDVNSLGSRG